jgi:hypothetical protein
LRRPKRVPTGTLPINPANETHLIDWKILWRSQFFTRSVSNFGTDRNEQEREREREIGIKWSGLQNKSKWEWNRNDFHFPWVEQSELTGDRANSFDEWLNLSRKTQTCRELAIFLTNQRIVFK